MLMELGCELAQGYGIARPMPVEALAEWVAGYRQPSNGAVPASAVFSYERSPGASACKAPAQVLGAAARSAITRAVSFVTSSISAFLRACNSAPPTRSNALG